MFLYMKILLIVTVENSVRNVNLIENNYNKLKDFKEISWAFNHFDGKNDLWKEKNWYNNLNCIKNVEIGSKINQWKKITPKISRFYDYLWFLDGDMGLEKFNWNEYYKMLVRWQPILSQPGILPSIPGGRASDFSWLCLNDKNKDKIFKLSNIEYCHIEVQTPFISTKIWDLLFEKIQLTDARADWEIGSFMNKITKDLNCKRLVNFKSPCVHYDFRNYQDIKSLDNRREYIESPDPIDYENKISKIKKIHSDFLLTEDLPEVL